MTVHFRVYSCTICFSHRSTCFIFCCSLHVFCTWMSLTLIFFKSQTGRKTFTLAGNRIHTLEVKGPPSHFHLKCYLIILSSVLHLHTYHISWSKRLISRSVASIYTQTPERTWTAKTHGNKVFLLLFPEKAFIYHWFGMTHTFLHYIGVFVLVFSLISSYYSIKLTASLAFSPWTLYLL